jgi:hypothetical protein
MILSWLLVTFKAQQHAGRDDQTVPSCSFPHKQQLLLVSVKLSFLCSSVFRRPCCQHSPSVPATIDMGGMLSLTNKTIKDTYSV